MDTLQLTTFLAIADTGSFSGAAERQHLTQPAVSKRVALLEEQVGTALFDRLGRSVELTQAGRALLPHARRILRESSDARRAIADLGGTVSGTLHIATSHHIGLHRLPPVLRDYSRLYPEVALDLQFFDSEKAIARVREGEFDLGVVTLGDEPDPRLTTLPVWKDQLHFVCAPGHPLGALKKPTLKDLTDHRAILPDSATYTTALVQSYFAREQLELDITMVTNHLDTIKMMVSIGLGWGVLPHTLLDDQLITLDLTHRPLTRQLGAVYHRRRTLSNAAQHFVGLLEDGERVTEHG